MPKFLLLLFLLLSGFTASGQTTFHRKYLGTNNTAYSRNIIALASGGFLVGNLQTAIQGASIFRLSTDGQVVWRNNYQPMFSILSMIESGDGFVVLGADRGQNGQTAYGNTTILKLDTNGSVVWGKRFPLSGIFDENNGLLKVPGGFIASSQRAHQVGNEVQPQTFIGRFDDNGNTLWSKSYFSDFINNSLQVRHIEGDTLYAVGNVRGNGCFARIDLNSGELLDINIFGGIYRENFNSIEPTADGNFLLAGFTFSTTGSEESRAWVVKVNRVGQRIWSKTYNIPGVSTTCYMAKSSDGNYVLSISGSSYACFLAIDENGDPIWAKNYAGSQYLALESIRSTADHGLVAIGGGSNSGSVILKTDILGKVAIGCCPEPIQFVVENFNPPAQNYGFTVVDWEGGISTVITREPATLTVEEYCQVPQTTLNVNIALCTEDSLEINGHFYHAPNSIRDTVSSITGGCDTVKIYNLTLIPQPFVVKTVKFCPGTSVNINGVTYSQPGTVTQILPATGIGCDTLLAYVLQYAPLPIRRDTIRFCQGDTAWIHGLPYLFPALLFDTLPGMGNECDTILHHRLLWLNNSPSFVQINCPDHMEISAVAPTAVTYETATATSDCPCPDISLVLENGLPSGSVFPFGTTQVCYKATDACYHSATCCFTVTLNEEISCDTKAVGCLTFELLGISTNQQQNHTYRIRVTNDCPNPLVYSAIGLQNSIVALEPASASIYIAPSGREYGIRNPSLSPFRCIRYKPLAGGIANGQSDVFEYTLPSLSSPTFIRVGASLAPNIFLHTTLNTFGCEILPENRHAMPGTRSEQDGLFMTPNPNSGTLTVDLSDWRHQEVTFTVRNAQGVLAGKFGPFSNSNAALLELPSSLNNGLYWLTLEPALGDGQSGKFLLLR